MRAWPVALLLLALAGGPVAAQPAPAAIDCAVARSPVEREICNGFKLRELDAQLALRYRELLSTLPPDAADRLRAEQRNWLRERDRTCTAAEQSYPRDSTLSKCLQDGYEGRITSLTPEAERFFAYPGEVGISRFPALPKLVHDTEPALCRTILTAVQAQYRRQGTLWPATASSRYAIPVRWLPSIQVSNPDMQNFGGSVSSATIRVAKVSRIAVVHRWTDWIRYTGTNYARLYLLPEAEQDRRWGMFRRSRERKHDLELAGSDASETLIEFFAWRDRVFALHHVDDRRFLAGQWSWQNRQSRPVQVMEIAGHSPLASICSIEGPDHPPLHAAVALEKTLFSLYGGALGHKPCDRCDAERWDDLRQLIAQPWFLRWPNQVKRSSPSRTEALIFEWGSLDLWNRRAALRILAARPEAEAVIGAFYQDAFGIPVDTARELAVEAVHRIMDNHNHAYDRFTSSLYLPDRLIHPLERLSETDEDKAAVGRILAGSPIAEDVSRVASLLRKAGGVGSALEYPDLLAAGLALGLSPDSPNRFGKTLLMYAAQFDLPATVKVLLERGASVASVTRELNIDPKKNLDHMSEPMSYSVTGGRTALDYAAQDGGEESLAMILRASVPLSVEARASALKYLETNWRQDDAARARMRAAIQAAP